jgi:cell division protein FtsB
MKWFAAALVAALVLLQYRLWFSNAGVGEMMRLKAAVSAQQADNQRLSDRNRQLAAEVRDLKQGYAALEERARTDLGMIGSNETFYQVRPSDARPAANGDAPAAPRRAPAGGPVLQPGAQGPGEAPGNAPGESTADTPAAPAPRTGTTLARAAGK